MKATDCAIDVHSSLDQEVYEGSKVAGRVEREGIG